MRLLKALIMGTVIIMMSQAAMAVDICTTSGTTIVCDNTYDYTNYRIGKLADEVNDYIVVCANIGGTWTQVGRESFVSGTTSGMEIYGCQYGETIEVVRNTSTTLDCETEGSEVTGIPDSWFLDGYQIYADGGDDRIIGSDHTLEYIYGEADDDRIMGYAGLDKLFGGDGVDTIWGGDGDDEIEGGAGNDYLYGDDDVDTIYGGTGDDRIEGNADGDYLYGDEGGDLIYGGSGDDYMWGDDGNDRMWGRAGNDIMRGGVGNDLLYGGDDDDDLYGDGGGNDDCDGEAGADTCDLSCEGTSSC